MSQRYRTDRPTQLTIYIPRSLADRLRAHVTDPLRARARYREQSELITLLLCRFFEELDNEQPSTNSNRPS